MSTKRFNACRLDGEAAREVREALVVEAPLHLRVNGIAYTTTMRTPGHDHELARGLLYTEGIVTERDARMAFGEVDDPETGIVACLELTIPEQFIRQSVDGRRSALATASCGLCGTREPRDIELFGPPLRVRGRNGLIAPRIPGMFRTMTEAQEVFRASGGSHAAGAFTVEGGLLAAREDVGRHNAVDKVVGTLLEFGSLEEADCLLVSGRVSYEIVYKAYRAGIPCVLAVSAPTSMAVETAERFGMTLVGFCRGDRWTVYSHPAQLSCLDSARKRDLAKS